MAQKVKNMAKYLMLASVYFNLCKVMNMVYF